MKKSPIFASIVVGLFFFAGIAGAQSGGVIIFDQLNSSSDAVTNVTISEIVATSTTGFHGYSPAYLHIILNPLGSTRTFEGNPSGVGSLRFYYNTACSGANLNFAVSDTVIASASGFDDYYLDLTNPMAVATSGVQCIVVKNIPTLGNSRIKTNAAHTLAFMEMGATFAAFPIGSFNTLVGTATTTSIFGSAATTTSACDEIENGFAWGMCSALAYVFVPEPTVLNGYTALISDVQTRFPVSYIYGMSDAFSSLAASSTDNLTPLAYNFHDLGIGSTTPMGNILPNLTVFATTTILTYISPTLWATFQSLIAIALWLGLAANIFFTVRNKMAAV